MRREHVIACAPNSGIFTPTCRRHLETSLTTTLTPPLFYSILFDNTSDSASASCLAKYTVCRKLRLVCALQYTSNLTPSFLPSQLHANCYQSSTRDSISSPSTVDSEPRNFPLAYTEFRMQRTVVTINSNGRQSASFIRVASALGWQVRAQMRDLNGVVAQEIAELENVTVYIGRLEDRKFLDDLFKSAQCAFINTTHWGDEVAIGRSLADAAKRAGIQHYIYSSMPDHSVFGQPWRSLPLWAPKFTVEQYIRQIGLPATFVYCGIYHNNFTGLDFPLFRMECQYDGSFVWQAPFHPDMPLPWLDSEHDVGPAIFQLFKEGPRKWNGKR